jgi:hypothetical protein
MYRIGLDRVVALGSISQNGLAGKSRKPEGRYREQAQFTLYTIEAENPDQLEGVLKCINFDATKGRTRLSDQNQ